MAVNLNLKSLGGEYVKSATLVAWHKNEGDPVQKGDVVVTAETAKVTVDIEAPASGILTKILFPVGEDVDINETIAIIGDQAEATPATVKVEGLGTVPVTAQTAAPAQTQNQEQQKQNGGRIFVSPIAKVIARENNIDVNAVPGTGPLGRIVKEDVLKYLAQNRAAEANRSLAEIAAPVTDSGPGQKDTVNIIKLSGRRKGIARKMVSSSNNIPHVTLHLDADVGKLKEIRAQLSGKPGDTGVNLNDLIMYFTVKALQKYPHVNAHCVNDEIRVFSNINLGVAVDLEEGLLVPVIRNCESKSVFEISAELKALAAKAKAGRISPQEITESTFTITNLGMFGIKYFTPIINEPEVAILGVGCLEKGEKEMLPLSFSFDHRVLDGAPAARFLQGLKEILENPYTVLF